MTQYSIVAYGQLSLMQRLALARFCISNYTHYNTIAQVVQFKPGAVVNHAGALIGIAEPL